MRKIAVLLGFVLAVTYFALTKFGALPDINEQQLPLEKVDQEKSVNVPEQNQNNELVPSQEKFIEVNGQIRSLRIPSDFEIEVFADGMDRPRAIVFDPSGNLFVTDIRAGKVYAISQAGVRAEIDDNLINPHGIDWYKSDLYVAEETQIVVYRGITQSGEFNKKDVLISSLPRGGSHVTRSLAISQDEKIYVSVGSTCNVCEESDPRYAAIVTYNLDGSNEQLHAEGLRNTVGMAFKDVPFGQELWGVDNGRDQIGDDVPVEELNLIKKGAHYGWPYCHGAGLENPEFPERDAYCRNDTTFPSFEMQAHSAPLGMTFTQEGFSDSATGDTAVIAFHGSWNRTIPTGYKIVTIDTSDENAIAADLITGWLAQNGDAWGRPVDVKFFNRALYISDDRTGVIYKLSKN